MKTLNNKRYLDRIAIACTVLCMCMAVGAQEMQKPEPAPEKMAEVPAADAQAEENKVENVKSEAIKLKDILSQEQKNEEIATVVGIASYYAAKFHGRRTASGEKFSSKLMTAAHLTLPFGTLLKVTNPANRKSVIVRVNDRGPYIRGRILDVSRAAAALIGIIHGGVARVELEILTK